MNIGLDLTWMTIENQHGGVFQYGMRIVTALVHHSSHAIIAIVSEGCEQLFDNLKGFSNFRLIPKNHGSLLVSIIEQEKIDIIHTPMQRHFNYTLAVPMISTLHDLQHFHFPGFFTQEQITYRDTYYKKSSEFSEQVIVSFQHVKDDIVKFYGIRPENISVCPLGMPELPNVTVEEVAEVKRKYVLPERYILYSANFWRHKNHIGLLRAMFCYREKFGDAPTLVFTGRQNEDFFPEIKAEVVSLNLTDHVLFTGYLPEDDLYAVLKGATLAVIPTLYEAGSFPLMEAMVSGVPVICSRVTSLPDTIGDVRFLFDPENPEEIAEKMAAILSEEWLRNENLANSALVIRKHSWENAVSAFVDTYERAVASFELKKKSVWYHDLASNYEFFMQDALQRGITCSQPAGLQAERLYAETIKRLEDLETSISWRVTKPIRGLLDVLRKK